MQFEIFNDSHSVAAVRCGGGPPGLASTLGQHYPQDDCLAPFLVLIDAVVARTAEPFHDHDALRIARLAACTLAGVDAAFRAAGVSR
jgi:hypothetical protein